MSDIERRGAVCRLSIPGGRWLGTGVNGGYRRVDGAVNIAVEGNFRRRDLQDYVAERCGESGFPADEPALLTAVDLDSARAATAGAVTVVATAGLSNPAALGFPSDEIQPRRPPVDESVSTGTVNLLVAVQGSLDDATLASGLATVVEAKTATLQAHTGFTGTTSDALAIGCDPAGKEITFVGSSTSVGSALRACVRDAVLASLEAVYEDGEPPRNVASSEHGARTTRRTKVFVP